MSRLLHDQGPLTSVERVAAAIRRDIEAGVLPIGASLRQEELGATYQVSRMPVREALRLLEAEGLVKIYPARGAFVTIPEAAAIRELYEIRALLEGEALQHALHALTPRDLLAAERHIEQLDEAPDSATWSSLDAALHTTLYQPAERPQLLELIATMRRRVNHFFYLAHTPDQYRLSCQAEHRALLAACKAGDSAAATQALQTHLHNAGEVVARFSEELRRS
ncbi:MAG: GntR family transcriptional regulator [Chloroflexaceae bacterium]|jgi:DNA-binding GntR family transcriptional regulator|nr:GntR family transcriptional regulator [Chloroflexaceae bacterium]